MKVKKTKLIYRISRGSIKEGATNNVREVEVVETKGGFNTRQSRRISGLDEPDIRFNLVVYSEIPDTKKVDRLCRKIRKAIDEYNGRNSNEKRCKS